MSVFNVHLHIFSMLTPSFFLPYIIHEVCSEYVPGDSFNHIIQWPIIISETIDAAAELVLLGWIHQSPELLYTRF
jgi:hypothetical protein